jgi:hypothetical protein
MDKQKSYKAVMIQSLILFATIMLMTTASAQAKTVIYKLTAVLDASDITYKKVNSADYDFSSGDILSVRLYIDDTQTDLDSDPEKGRFENGSIALSFTITSSTGAVVYSSVTASNHDTTLKLENNHNGDYIKLKGDFDSLKVVPIPAAAWLFGSALFALVAISRRMPA